jgi:hypothetical protein
MKFIAFLFISSYSHTNSFQNAQLDYASVIRTELSNAKIISLFPQPWLSKALKSSLFQQEKREIKEFIYIPSLFSISECDDFESCLDDEHFCSKLCDAGYKVHIINPIQIEKDKQSLFFNEKKINEDSYDDSFDKIATDHYLIRSIRETINWRTCDQKTPKNSLAIISSELSVGAVLNYLSNESEIAAAVLIDPIPINSMHSSNGRKKILQKYFFPLKQEVANLQPLSTSASSKKIKKRSKIQ